jgi:hypothetical protein
MYAVGVTEIIAGVVVAIHPRLGGPVVAAWLLGIIVNLPLIPGFYDVALRDGCSWLPASRPRSWPRRPCFHRKTTIMPTTRSPIEEATS